MAKLTEKKGSGASPTDAFVDVLRTVIQVFGWTRIGAQESQDVFYV